MQKTFKCRNVTIDGFGEKIVFDGVEDTLGVMEIYLDLQEEQRVIIPGVKYLITIQDFDAAVTPEIPEGYAFDGYDPEVRKDEADPYWCNGDIGESILSRMW